METPSPPISAIPQEESFTAGGLSLYSELADPSPSEALDLCPPGA